MNLLVIFIISVVIGQSLSIGLGLLVERYSTPYTGMVTFIGSYFVMFLAGLALCGPHHRTAVAGTRRLEQRRKVIGERGRVSGHYCRPPDPCIDSSGRVSPNAVPFLPAATPTS